MFVNRREDRDMKEVLSDVGFAFELLKVLVHAILKKGGSGKDLKRVLSDKTIADKIADIIVILEPVVSDIVRAKVDYSTPSFEELIASFSWVNSWYRQAIFRASDACAFVGRGSCELDFVCLHMDYVASTGAVLSEMKKRGLRPALFEEALGFSKADSSSSGKLNIVVLGSTCAGPEGSSYVACLADGKGGRRLNLDWSNNDWTADTRFLAVKE